MRATLSTMLLLCSIFTPPLRAQSDDTLRVRVADVGPGLCTVTRAPGGAVMVYDAGHWLGQGCLATVRSLVPGDTIDLLVLSHSDSDHLGDAAEILGDYTVRRILWTGFRRPGVATWERTNDAIAGEVRTQGASVRSLITHPLISGETIPLGEATITLVAGWGGWVGGTGLSEVERRNAVSIVLRVDYRGGSVLYAGDTVGRRTGDPANACKDAESAMVANHDAGVARAPAERTRASAAANSCWALLSSMLFAASRRMASASVTRSTCSGESLTCAGSFGGRMAPSTATRRNIGLTAVRIRLTSISLQFERTPP